MMKNLSGIYEIDFSISSKGAEQITDPSYLDKLEEFSAWLKDQPEVDHGLVFDIFKRLNKICIRIKIASIQYLINKIWQLNIYYYMNFLYPMD